MDMIGRIRRLAGRGKKSGRAIAPMPALRHPFAFIAFRPMRERGAFTRGMATKRSASRTAKEMRSNARMCCTNGGALGLQPEIDASDQATLTARA